MLECPKCHGAGKYVGKFGIETLCECTYTHPIKPVSKPINVITQADKIVCGSTAKCLIPDYRLDDNFTVKELRERIEQFYGSKKLEIKQIEEYEQLMCSILCTIEQNGKLPRSYIIGAPRGLGKNTLANTCIKLLNKQEKKVVPYTSLTDIYELYILNLKNQFVENRYTKIQECHDNRSEIIQEYTLKDFLECDVLFTHLISPEFKYQEITMLRLLLSHRGKVGKPTIVFTSIPLTSYLYYKDDKRYFWDEYLDYQDNSKVSYATLNYKFYFKFFKNEK